MTVTAQEKSLASFQPIAGELASPSHIEVSVILPCLNEASTVGDCVRKCFTAFADLGVEGEVIVVDNGSVDGSVAVALNAGARVVQERHRGYGYACRRGLAEARGQALVLGDADGTYDFSALGGFVNAMRNGSDVVVGTRLKGVIEDGAMPWLHRYVGNPLLTKILNGLISSEVSDAHCGLRSIKRDRYLELTLASPGMEFASEFLIAASRQGLSIQEIPIVYYRRQGGEPKLRTFRDGWRHLKFMILASPFFGPTHPFRSHESSAVAGANGASGGVS